MRPVSKKKIAIALGAILLLAIGCLIWGFFIEPNRLVVNRSTIQIGNWPASLGGLKIVAIGDIHTDNRFIDERKLHRIVELTNAEQPDLVVLLGDFIQGGRRNTSHQVAPEITAGALKDLRAPLGVYAVLGNHDWWYGGEKVRAAFEQNGITVLDNEVKEIKWRDGSFWLVGLADLWMRTQHVGETIAKVPPGATVIAMTHNPDVFPNLPAQVPLLLAAHTHGGQVKLPLIGTPIVPSNYGPKYTAGHVFENGHHMFVTTGIGTSILRVRFRVPPEIAVLTITR
jgi:uncharacterized protein